MTPDLDELHYLRYSICVSGAAAGPTVQQSQEEAEQLGEAIARAGHIITTGATVGLPYHAAIGAKAAGGTSIGFSPASSIREHIRKYRLPYDAFDFINFTGMNYVGRDLYLVQSSNAVITVGGRIGSLHEFTSAIVDRKICGILSGSGGAADIIPELLKTLSDVDDDLILFDDDPERLVKRIVEMLDSQYKDVREDIDKHDYHWYLYRHSPSNPPPRAG